jgi:putative ABC transport system permease protein
VGGLVEIFVLGLRNLRRNKLRTLLTLLGMIFGVGSVIAMLSVGAGARAELLARIGELGVRNVLVNSVRPPEQKRSESVDDESAWIDRYGLTKEDRERIEKVCPHLERLLPVNLVNDRVWYGSARIDGTILGVPPEYLEIFRVDPSIGRRFHALDDREGREVCLVRRSLLRELGVLEEPLGLTLRLGPAAHPFEVVGVLEDAQYHEQTRDALDLKAGSHELFVPFESSMRAFGTVVFKDRGGQSERSAVELDRLVAVADAPENVRMVAQVVDSILKRFHEQQDYEIVVPMALLEQQERTQRVFNVVMVLIASISLLVGGIGIANIMLATVTERTREIGIRRALGARRVDVMAQFLTETLAIGLIGGCLGCGFGWLALQGIVRATGWQAQVGPTVVLIALGISCGVAVVSGLYPARRGARLDPIQALR